MAIPTLQEVEDFKIDLDDAESLVNGTGSVTTRLGGTKKSLDQLFQEAVAGTVTAYSSGTTYTLATEWVEQAGVVYRPLPSALPIGPEAFNASNWIVHQSTSAIATNTTDIATNASDIVTNTNAIAANLLSTKQTGLFVWDAAITYNDGALVLFDLASATDEYSGETLDFEVYQNTSGATSLNDTPSEASAIWTRRTLRRNNQFLALKTSDASSSTLQKPTKAQGNIDLLAGYHYRVNGMFHFDGADATSSGIQFQIDFESGNTFFGVVSCNVGASSATRYTNANGGTQTASIDLTPTEVSVGGGDNHIKVDGYVVAANAVTNLVPEFARNSAGTGTLTFLYGSLELTLVTSAANYAP